LFVVHVAEEAEQALGVAKDIIVAPAPSPLPSRCCPPAPICDARAVKVYRPSLSEPNSVSLPVKALSVTTVMLFATLALAAKATAPARVSVNALATVPAKLTWALKLTVRLVT